MIRAHLMAVILFLSFWSHSARALVFDLNGFYFQDNVTIAGTSTTENWSALDAALGIGLDQDKMYNVGFNVVTAGNNETVGSAKTEWSTFDYGLKFMTYFDRTKEWGLGLAYNPFAKATVNYGSTSDNWRGTSFLVSLGYNPLFVFGTYFGLRLNYYSATYTEVSQNGGNYVTQTNTRSFFYPSLFISFH